MTEEWQHDLTPPLRLPDEPDRPDWRHIIQVWGRAFGKAAQVMHNTFTRATNNAHHLGIELHNTQASKPKSENTNIIYPTSYDNWYREYENKIPDDQVRIHKKPYRR